MGDVVAYSRKDELWAVIAWFGAQRRIAEIFSSRALAAADREWREAQVAAYASLLRGRHAPRYVIAPVRRSDLPRKWRPLPALGFLNES